MAQASAGKLEHTGPAKKERVTSVPQRIRSICPKHQIVREERVKVGESCTLARKRGSEREHGKKGWTPP